VWLTTQRHSPCARFFALLFLPTFTDLLIKRTHDGHVLPSTLLGKAPQDTIMYSNFHHLPVVFFPWKRSFFLLQGSVKKNATFLFWLFDSTFLFFLKVVNRRDANYWLTLLFSLLFCEGQSECVSR
jgi:hypothetical protein